jgi:natural resistance-associated macrophage protein
VKEEVNDANRYVFIESAIAMGISLIINIAVTSVFAHGLYGRTNREIYETCILRNDSRFDINAFSNDTEDFDADLYKAGVFLGCQFGLFTMYIWAIGILAGGQSSTMTGTYAGQYVFPRNVFSLCFHLLKIVSYVSQLKVIDY